MVVIIRTTTCPNFNRSEIDQNGFLYAGTSGMGVYKSRFSTVDAEEVVNPEYSVAVWPNPSQGNFHLKLEGPETGKTVIARLYAADGRMIEERKRMGVWVIAFLVVFSVLAYLMKKEWFKDIH